MVWYGISLRILARDLLTSLFTPRTHYMWCLSSHSTHNKRVNKGATSPSRRIAPLGYMRFLSLHYFVGYFPTLSTRWEYS